MGVGNVCCSTPTWYGSVTDGVHTYAKVTCSRAFVTTTGATGVVTLIGAAESLSAQSVLIAARTSASLNLKRATSVARSLGAVAVGAEATARDGGGLGTECADADAEVSSDIVLVMLNIGLGKISQEFVLQRWL